MGNVRFFHAQERLRELESKFKQHASRPAPGISEQRHTNVSIAQVEKRLGSLAGGQREKQDGVYVDALLSQHVSLLDRGQIGLEHFHQIVHVNGRLVPRLPA